MSEGLNPTRRYKWFRPRQAAWLFGSFTATVNLSDIVLYNNSTGAQVIVVRDIYLILGNNGQPLLMKPVQGQFATLDSSFVPFPVVPSGPRPPGQIFTLDDATALSKVPEINSVAGGPIWNHDFPLWVLEPNWSLILQCAAGFAVSFLYEYLTIDELDYAFEL